ncbi:hypothetical protein DL95DRAFT_468296 [Leptodontidium sp. 2 PMI_412]|nr:hypothetical protein DL95DRAFT_468296 [Leptodontidium sp. 2 PMI_412]
MSPVPDRIQPIRTPPSAPEDAYGMWPVDLADKPYVCQFCTVASSRKDVILRHTRNFHAELVHDDAQPEDFAAGLSRSPQRSPNSFSPMSGSDLALGTPQVNDELSQDQDGDQDGDHYQDLNQDRDQVQDHDQAQHHGPPQEQAHVQVLAQSQDHNQNQDHPPDFWDQPANIDHALLEYALDFDFETFNLPTNEFFPRALDPLPALPLNAHSGILYPFFPLPQDTPPPNAERLPASSSSSSSPSRDADYESARGNFNLHHREQISSAFSFPSKDTVYRLVDTFFTHTAPHMPLVHQPTFNIATTASPLLMEVMAFGALYLCKRTTAVALHSATQQLMFQSERGDESHEDNPNFQLWTLQTYLLMSYFGAYGGNLAMQQRVTHVFPYAIKLAQDAFQEIDLSLATTYKGWVYQESISRAIAHTIEIGAAFASTGSEQCFTLPFFDMSFPLPSSETVWQQDERSWQGSSQQLDSCQALTSIITSRKAISSVSDLGLTTLVSCILWRFCSFEVITGSYRLELCADVVNKTDRAVRALDVLLKERMVHKDGNHRKPDPLLYSARALLNSTFYHLYASETLTEMKRLLKFPRKRKASAQNTMMAGREHSTHISIALVRAAEALKSDCSMGVNYLQRIAPHQIGPVCAIACCEGGLLLSWYLSNKVSLRSMVESSATLDRVIDIVSSEMDETCETSHGKRFTLPLEVAAELLSDRSVWQFPSGISEKLKQLTRNSANEPHQLALSM